MTVLAPSASSQALRSGRRRLRALAAGDGEALQALPGEPLAVAVGPAVPQRQRAAAARGAGLPVAASANVALAVGEGGFDIVARPRAASCRVWPPPRCAHTRGLTVATFHAETERALSYPIRGGRRKRYRARIDALLATSPRAAELAAHAVPGRLRDRCPTRSPACSSPAGKTGTQGRGRVDGRGPRRRPQALIRIVADTPGAELTLVWDRRGRRPMRPVRAGRARGAACAPMGCERDEQARPAAGRRRRVRGGAGWRTPLLAWEARASRRRRGLGRRRPPGLRYAPDQPPLAAAAAARLLERRPSCASGWRPRATAPPPSAARRALAERLEPLYPACCGGAAHGPRRRRRGRC